MWFTQTPRAADVALHWGPSYIPAETSWMHLPIKPNCSSIHQETLPADVKDQANRPAFVFYLMGGFSHWLVQKLLGAKAVVFLNKGAHCWSLGNKANNVLHLEENNTIQGFEFDWVFHFKSGRKCSMQTFYITKEATFHGLDSWCVVVDALAFIPH